MIEVDSAPARTVSADEPPADGVRLERIGRRWLIWSFILCPCHLPWTLALLTAALGGSALGAVVSTHRNWVGLLIAVLYGVGVAIGFRYLRRAKTSGACRISYR
jgi:hypothetical protein